MKYSNLLFITGFLTVVGTIGCSKEKEGVKKECVLNNVSGTFNIYKPKIPCKDLGIPWEISFGAKFEFDYSVFCGTDCVENTVIFRESYSYVKHVDGSSDTFYFPFTGLGCNYARDSGNVSFPSLTLESAADDPDPRNYGLGDTIVFHLGGAIMCQVEGNDTYCTWGGVETPLPLPDYTFKFELTEENFDCN